MKKLVVYYSYTGGTKRVAEEKAAQLQADLLEVGKAYKPSKLGAFLGGSFAAMRGKSANIENIADKLAAYDEISIMGPVWAGLPAPAVNAILAQLPQDKQVNAYMFSATGHSRCREYFQKKLAEKNCHLQNYEDIKTRK